MIVIFKKRIKWRAVGRDLNHKVRPTPRAAHRPYRTTRKHRRFECLLHSCSSSLGALKRHLQGHFLKRDPDISEEKINHAGGNSCSFCMWTVLSFALKVELRVIRNAATLHLCSRRGQRPNLKHKAVCGNKYVSLQIHRLHRVSQSRQYM